MPRVSMLLHAIITYSRVSCVPYSGNFARQKFSRRTNPYGKTSLDDTAQVMYSMYKPFVISSKHINVGIYFLVIPRRSSTSTSSFVQSTVLSGKETTHGR